MNNEFEYLILESINNAVKTVKATPLILGGVAGSGGGVGGPVGGTVGYLTQTRVAYDITESGNLYTPPSGESLLDNLNHIRYRIGQLEAGSGIFGSGISTVEDDNTLSTYNNVTVIHFSGAGVTINDLGGGEVQAVITAGSGSGATTFLDLTDTPSSYTGNAGKSVIVNPTEDGLIFATISGGGSGNPISVYDNSIPVASGIIILDFGDNLDVTDLGGGHVLIDATFSGVIASGNTTSFLVHEDFSSIAAGLTHFDSLYIIQSGSLSIYYNGIRQEPINHYLEDSDGYGFTTLFTPASGDALLADYITPISGYPAPSAGTTIIYSGLGGHIIQDEGVSLSNRAFLDFVGNLVSVTDDSINNKTIVTISGTISSGSAHIIQDEGSSLPDRAYLDFVGSGVSVLDIGGKTTVSIPGTAISGVAWGDITGTLSNQTDLQNALDLKANASSVKEVLSADRTYYVRTDGSDSNTGLVDSAGGAFLTIQKAVNTAAMLESHIYDVTIQVRNGTYGGTITARNMGGSGTITIIGDETTPSNVTISLAGSIFSMSNIHTLYSIKGVKLVASSGGIAVQATRNSKLNYQNVEFGACGGHILSSQGALITATGNYLVSGGASYHITCTEGAEVVTTSRTITFSNSPAFTGRFIDVDYQSTAKSFSMTFTNGGTVTGVRYRVQRNGIIDTSGGGANYFPGDSAGSAATQGQYL